MFIVLQILFERLMADDKSMRSILLEVPMDFVGVENSKYSEPQEIPAARPSLRVLYNHVVAMPASSNFSRIVGLPANVKHFFT